MPLDTTNGEPIEGLTGPFRVVPAQKWMFLTRLKVDYLVPHPFRTIKKQRAIFLDSAEKAIEAFEKAGALRPIRFGERDILVQEYPQAKAVVFVFRRKVADVEKFVPVKYELGPEVIGFLKTTGRWDDAPATH